MAGISILKDDLRFLIFGELYSRYSEPKTRRRAFMILESAINCFAKNGFEHVTLTMIARESGVTRQLLDHYFEGLGEIRELALKYIRLVGQSLVVAEIRDEKRPDLVLASYIRAHRIWITKFKPHIRVWQGFLTSCITNKSDRNMNTMAVGAGTNRLQELIETGKVAQVFSVNDSREAARLIQIVMYGWLTTMVTEDDSGFDRSTETVVRNCMQIVGCKTRD